MRRGCAFWQQTETPSGPTHQSWIAAPICLSLSLSLSLSVSLSQSHSVTRTLCLDLSTTHTHTLARAHARTLTHVLKSHTPPPSHPLGHLFPSASLSSLQLQDAFPSWGRLMRLARTALVAWSVCVACLLVPVALALCLFSLPSFSLPPSALDLPLWCVCVCVRACVCVKIIQDFS